MRSIRWMAALAVVAALSRPAHAASTRPCRPLDLVVALDVSGTIGDVAAARSLELLHLLADGGLAKDDRLEVLAFGDGTEVVQELGPPALTATLPDSIRRAAKRLRKRTDVEAALLAAGVHLDSAVGKPRDRLVLVVGDGKPDVRGQSQEQTRGDLLGKGVEAILGHGAHVAVVALTGDLDYEVASLLPARTGGFAFRDVSEAGPRNAVERLRAWRAERCKKPAATTASGPSPAQTAAGQGPVAEQPSAPAPASKPAEEPPPNVTARSAPAPGANAETSPTDEPSSGSGWGYALGGAFLLGAAALVVGARRRHPAGERQAGVAQAAHRTQPVAGGVAGAMPFEEQKRTLFANEMCARHGGRTAKGTCWYCRRQCCEECAAAERVSRQGDDPGESEVRLVCRDAACREAHGRMVRS